MNDKFKFLRIAVLIFKILAWISAAFFLIVTVVVLSGAGGPDTPRAASLIFLLGGALYFFILFCISEICKMLINLAEKIDTIAELLEGKPPANL